MKRLFYFTGYRLSVLYYKKKTLAGNVSFEPTVEGFEDFKKYLLQTDNFPSGLLVDVIEEDFRKEKIPHVGGKDRKAVVTRLMDRFYRSSQNYCYDEIIGREKGGRKDDVVLIGAITNPQLIQPWINILDECETPLSGIWSLPLVSKQLLKYIKATSGCVLLVSQQVNSNVRQTLFKDGVLMSSRQSIINQGLHDISGIGELAAPEVIRTIEFLRAQNLITVGEVVQLHIIGSDSQIPSLQASFIESDLQSVTIHNIKDILSDFGLSKTDDRFSDGIFSWLCVSQKLCASHYGAKEVFARYHNTLASKVLYVASLLVVMFATLMTQSNISSAFESEKSIALLNEEELAYKKLYTEKFKEFEKVFENAGVMNSAVELAERIKLNSATSPLAFLINLSVILSSHQKDTFHIDKIEWQAVSFDSVSEKYIDANFTANAPVFHKAIVTGRINDPEHKYRDSVNHVQRIIAEIESDNRVESVSVLLLPVDMRSESNFSTESGLDTKQTNIKDISGVFTLQILMKAPEHV